ncbi:small acid-soluble spore protein Tlp [Fictibacillus nanhaiensis]|uniref:small acid-soluble spore protein Tlp n=1 Tax=Fictibacillus nanhaiensis TaxID=742169 RepID=UPI001C958728|nr:small acid-soluble spore protein Tlp [Fictibacillus nanhaiensis]MBY6035936.1 small acid-soluble spore protein Tlp [Fictibacillus nanhaiensis]
MQKQPNRDDRSNNVERLEQMVENTEHNMQEANETMNDSELTASQKEQIKEKNQHREESIEQFKIEIQEEKAYREGNDLQ